jgi:hypothetical protein
MRKVMRMGWIPLLAALCAVPIGAGFMLVSCLGADGTSGGELTELAGLRVDESRMRAEVDSGRLVFRMVLERTQPRSFHGVLKVDLQDLQGESYDRRETMFSLQEDQREYSFTLRGIPELDGLEDLAASW